MRQNYVDNRCSSRYEPIKNSIYLGWWEEPEYRSAPAVLRNLSHGGALVQLGFRPPLGTSLWLCLAGSPPSEWVEVSVVDETTLVEGLHEVHVRFPDSCPYELFNGAVLGFPPVADKPVESEA